MRTEQEIIEEYRKKYFEEFGEEITFNEAQQQLTHLVRFLRAVLYPDSD